MWWCQNQTIVLTYADPLKPLRRCWPSSWNKLMLCILWFPQRLIFDKWLIWQQPPEKQQWFQQTTYIAKLVLRVQRSLINDIMYATQKCQCEAVGKFYLLMSNDQLHWSLLHWRNSSGRWWLMVYTASQMWRLTECFVKDQLFKPADRCFTTESRYFPTRVSIVSQPSLLHATVELTHLWHHFLVALRLANLALYKFH